MRRLSVAGFVLALMAVATMVVAAETANPTGTWKWTMTGGRGGKKGGAAREQVLKLKLEGTTLTGAMVGRNDEETKIEDAKYKDGELSFSVTREFNGNKMTTKYTGKVTGDTIKGTIERPGRGGGEATKVDWEAKRAEEKKAT